MNDDDPREVLALLKAEHRRLDQEIELLRDDRQLRPARACADEEEEAGAEGRDPAARRTASSPTSSPDKLSERGTAAAMAIAAWPSRAFPPYRTDGRIGGA